MNGHATADLDEEGPVVVGNGRRRCSGEGETKMDAKGGPLTSARDRAADRATFLAAARRRMRGTLLLVPVVGLAWAAGLTPARASAVAPVVGAWLVVAVAGLRAGHGGSKGAAFRSWYRHAFALLDALLVSAL